MRPRSSRRPLWKTFLRDWWGFPSESWDWGASTEWRAKESCRRRFGRKASIKECIGVSTRKRIDSTRLRAVLSDNTRNSSN
mmetsp:Transcript_5112/g.14858  ORF Transcript_5112/g.14858 Transcript_5112/m.14858 type:complete len:81 (-) Transcript_5112:364-606(-)